MSPVCALTSKSKSLGISFSTFLKSEAPEHHILCFSSTAVQPGLERVKTAGELQLKAY